MIYLRTLNLVPCAIVVPCYPSLLCVTSSVQFGHSVVSDSLWSHGLKHARLPCPSSTPGACENSSPLGQWYQSNHLLLCRPLLLLPSIFPSIRVFSNESVLCIRWPKYSNEYSGLISFRIDWLDLLAVQGTLKILLQHHSSKTSILCLYSPTFTSIHDYWKNHSFWLDGPLLAK